MSPKTMMIFQIVRKNKTNQIRGINCLVRLEKVNLRQLLDVAKDFNKTSSKNRRLVLIHTT